MCKLKFKQSKLLPQKLNQIRDVSGKNNLIGALCMSFADNPEHKLETNDPL